MKRLKYLLFLLIMLLLALLVIVYACLRLSLPQLEGTLVARVLNDEVILERDKLGTAVITAKGRLDLSYALGFAHGQDRFFQMDLLRRNAAGELSAIFGAQALTLDKKHRFHQFRLRADKILQTLPAEEKAILLYYTQGVNAALSEQAVYSFEYLLLRASPAPWQMSDSLLVIFSMYLDLQAKTIERDLVLTVIKQHFGQNMVDFIIQPSQYQAALDLSRIPLSPPVLPILPQGVQSPTAMTNIDFIADPPQKGSNNWAVGSRLTKTDQAMLSNDMHLSLGVPIIWYRTQLNYLNNATQQRVQVTGVSLPGTPGVIVGSNGHIAWGFTNAYLDTADWVALPDDLPLTLETERILLADGNVEEFTFEMSPFGPVISLKDLLSQNGGLKNTIGIKKERKYALSWVGYQDYAVNFKVLDLEKMGNVDEALQLALDIEIPIQNMLLIDKNGNLAWQPTGAFPARLNPSNTAMQVEGYQADLWQQDARDLPQSINPELARLWTANARAVSVKDNARLGDGGYALGARNVQIYEGLMSSELFDEQAFYRLQRDNRAHFLQPWQAYLLSVLLSQKASFKEDIELVQNWQACACEGSVGYTLVKGFRDAVLSQLFLPIAQALKPYGLDLSVIKRYLEPGVWQLIAQQPATWLPLGQTWDALIVSAYINSKKQLLNQYSDNKQLSELSWGNVNRLHIQHPFSRIFPILSPFLDMPSTLGFGDNFMPAVQSAHFGASERFIVQPSREEHAILTLPGGQSAHPLSQYYRSGYGDYIHNADTPLLPQQSEYKLTLSPE